MAHVLNLNRSNTSVPGKTFYTPATDGQRMYLASLAAGFGESLSVVVQRFGIDIATLTSAQAQTLIATLKSELAPPITCRVCGTRSQPNIAAILLCSACLHNLDAARAQITRARECVFQEFDAAHAQYIAVLDASEIAVQTWWEKILAKRAVLGETESDDLIARAWATQGRATNLITAWRVWCAQNIALGHALDRLRAAQEEINLAAMEQEGAL